MPSFAFFKRFPIFGLHQEFQTSQSGQKDRITPSVWPLPMELRYHWLSKEYFANVWCATLALN